MKELLDSGCCGKLRKNQQGVKLLGNGSDQFKAQIDIEVSQISTSALQAIQKNGGTIKLVYYNSEGLRSLIKPHRFKEMPYLPPPPLKGNRKLHKPQVQPAQQSDWLQRRELFLETIKSEQQKKEQSPAAQTQPITESNTATEL